MIYDPSAPGALSPVASHVAGQIEALAGAARLPDPYAVELGRAVDYFLRHDARVESVGSVVLAKLAAKALCGLGETAVSHRVFLFGAEMAHEARPMAAGGPAFWVLNVGELAFPGGGAALEISFFGRLHMAVEAMADVWDATGGSGALGLRNARAAAAVLLNRRATNRAVRSFERETRDRCGWMLERIRARRAWRAAPRVMNLDW